jgi:hypothetical protein
MTAYRTVATLGYAAAIAAVAAFVAGRSAEGSILLSFSFVAAVFAIRLYEIERLND